MNPLPRATVHAHRRSQHGMVLVTGLLLLVLVTLVVLGASRGGRLQTVMAGNTRDRDLAFQAAEAALLDGEERVAAFHDVFTAPANVNASNPAAGLLNRNALATTEKTRLIVLGSRSDYWVSPAGTDGYGWFDGNGGIDRSKSIASNKTVSGVDAQPRFVVEYLGKASNSGLSGSRCGNQSHHRYRITTLAVGASAESRKQADTRVILQSEYAWCASAP